MNALTGYRTLPNDAMARRDLSRDEAAALEAHRMLLAKARTFAAELRTLRSGAAHIDAHLTEASEIADTVNDYADVLESECERINAGEAVF